jgi:hypothetical protein
MRDDSVEAIPTQEVCLTGAKPLNTALNGKDGHNHERTTTSSTETFEWDPWRGCALLVTLALCRRRIEQAKGNLQKFGLCHSPHKIIHPRSSCRANPGTRHVAWPAVGQLQGRRSQKHGVNLVFWVLVCRPANQVREPF